MLAKKREFARKKNFCPKKLLAKKMLAKKFLAKKLSPKKLFAKTIGKKMPELFPNGKNSGMILQF